MRQPRGDGQGGGQGSIPNDVHRSVKRIKGGPAEDHPRAHKMCAVGKDCRRSPIVSRSGGLTPGMGCAADRSQRTAGQAGERRNVDDRRWKLF